MKRYVRYLAVLGALTASASAQNMGGRVCSSVGHGLSCVSTATTTCR